MFRNRPFDDFVVSDLTDSRTKNFLFELRMHFKRRAGNVDQSKFDLRLAACPVLMKSGHYMGMVQPDHGGCVGR